ncbi:MAG: hypothetical protein ACFFEM_06080 [Candidatus Thorarchaeota archaeon]
MSRPIRNGFTIIETDALTFVVSLLIILLEESIEIKGMIATK